MEKHELDNMIQSRDTCAAIVVQMRSGVTEHMTLIAAEAETQVERARRNETVDTSTLLLRITELPPLQAKLARMIHEVEMSTGAIELLGRMVGLPPPRMEDNYPWLRRVPSPAPLGS
jgi:hypothetical protein